MWNRVRSAAKNIGSLLIKHGSPMLHKFISENVVPRVVSALQGRGVRIKRGQVRVTRVRGGSLLSVLSTALPFAPMLYDGIKFLASKIIPGMGKGGRIVLVRPRPRVRTNMQGSAVRRRHVRRTGRGLTTAFKKKKVAPIGTLKRYQTPGGLIYLKPS